MRILVVDDHPIFLAGLEYLLTSQHPEYAIATVESAEQCLARLKWERFDLMVMDLNLPEIDGVALYRTLCERKQTPATLVISADVEHARLRQLFEMGALGFVHKSAAPAEMLTAIKLVARQQRYLPQEIHALVQSQEAVCRNLGVTPRQVSVLELVAEGLSNREIAERLSLTEYTVKSHVRGLFHRLDCKNRTSCVRNAQALGLIA